MKYLDDLNPEQRKAALQTEGPVMVLAGPGSGKTKTIVSRIIHIIKTCNVQPWQILAVTFSNRSANEMKERVHLMLPELKASSLNISTFHSFCAKLLRYQGAGALKLNNNFSIYDDSESLAVAKEILRRHDIDPKKTPASALTHFVDKVKNEGYYLGRPNFKLKKELKDSELYPLFVEYENELVSNNAIDFGGLITRSIELLENFPEIKESLLLKYKYVMVDEYQDTNKAQFDLMCLLTNPLTKNICVVGDEDQCLIEGTLISLPNDTTKAINQLVEGDLVKSFSNPLCSNKIKRINKSYVSKKITKITTSADKILSSTNEHCHLKLYNKELPNNKVIFFESENLHFINYNNQKTIGSIELLQKIIRLNKYNLPSFFKIKDNYYELVLAKDLMINDILLNEQYNHEKITLLENINYDGYVYDLDIESSHNFIANGLFTHNSIYSWRGAEIKNILDFEKTFKDTVFLRLEQNYRSSDHIVKSASQVVQRNSLRKGKNLWTKNPIGEKIKIYECYDGNREALFVAQSISDLLKKQVPAKEIAVFYRTNSQSRNMEDACRKFMIPYKVIGGVKFYERKEIKDMIAYLQLLMNPQDNISLLRIINIPTRGLGEKTIEKLLDNAKNEGMNFWSYLVKNKDTPKKFGSPKAQAGILDFINIVSSGIDFVNRGFKISDIYDYLLDNTGYIDILKASTKYEDLARIDNLRELKTSIVQFQNSSTSNSLKDYLETITLDRTEDQLSTGEVSLMTIHASKGLEFDHVFLIGCEETIFPSPQSLSEGLDRMEEERRLFYVAITRARKNLSILYALSRMVYGKISNNPPSRFIMELPKEFLQKFKV